MIAGIKLGAIALVGIAFLGSCASPRAAVAECRVTKRSPLPVTVVIGGNTAFRPVRPFRQPVVELTPTGEFRRRLGGIGVIVGRVDGSRFEYGVGPVKLHSTPIEGRRVKFGIGLMPAIFDGSDICTDEQLMLGAVAHLILDDR